VGRTSGAQRPATSIQINPRIQDVVAFATQVSPQEAIRASRHCFDQGGTYPSLSIADQCIAFDLAFARAQPGLGGRYFDGRAMVRRHIAALDPLVGRQNRMIRYKAIAAKTASALTAVQTARSEGVLPPIYSPGIFPQ